MKEASVVLKHILTENRDCVVALAPIGLRGAYMRVIRKAVCVTVVSEDTPDNILQRIVFYDIDSRPIDRTLTETDHALYRGEIAGVAIP